jgi:O-antigen ligase
VFWLLLIISSAPKLSLPSRPAFREMFTWDVSLIVYLLCSTLIAYARHESGASVLYAGYIVARVGQAMSIWYIASEMPISGRHLNQLMVALILPGLVNAAVANLQGLGLLGFRPFVSHLPPTTSAGPWAARVLSEESFSLGMLGYNRIYVGIQLAAHSVAILALMRKGWLAYILLAVNLSALLWTGSRTALLFLGVSIAAVVILSKQRTVLVALGVIGAATIAGTSELAWQMRRGLLLGGETLAESTAGRFEVQSLGFRVFAESTLNSIIGCGPGHLGLYSDSQGFYQAHSQYIQVLSEYGLVGFSVWGLWYWKRVSSLTRGSWFHTVSLSIFSGMAVSAFFNDLMLPNPAFGSLMAFTFVLLGLGSNPSANTDSSILARLSAQDPRLKEAS